MALNATRGLLRPQGAPGAIQEASGGHFGASGPPFGDFWNMLVKTRQTTQTNEPRYPRDSIATQRWVGGAFQRGPGEAPGGHFWTFL